MALPVNCFSFTTIPLKPNEIMRFLEYFAKPGNAAIFPAAFTGVLFLSGSIMISTPLISDWSLLYLYGAVPWISLCGLLGYRWSHRNIPRNRVRRLAVPNASQLQSIALKFSLLSIAASIFSLLDLRENGFTSLLGDMGALRIVSFESRTANIFSYASYLTLPFSLFSFVIVVLFWEELRPAFRLLCLSASLTNVVIITVLVAGRLYIITFALTLLWFAFQRRWYGKQTIPSSFVLRACLVLGICGLLAYIPLISVVRSTKENQAEFALEAMSPMVTPSVTMLEIIDVGGPFIGAATVELLTYWTSAVVAFDRVYHLYSIPPSYVGGIFPMIERRLASIGLVPDKIEQQRQWVEIAEDSGFYQNMWVTTAFNIIQGFGRSFGLVVMGLMAFCFSWAYGMSIRTGSLPLMIFGFLGWLYYLTWFQRTIFEDPIYEYSLYWLCVYWAHQRLNQWLAPACVRTADGQPIRAIS